MFWLKTIPQGQQVATWDRHGRVEVVAGPRLIGTWGKRVQRLHHYAAGPDQYLRVVRTNGRTDHLPGPVECWQHPVDHEEVQIRQVVDIDAHQAIVVYRPEGDAVERRVVRGPARFVPGPTEWLHQFQWHGADPDHPERKVPRTLQFTKLRVIPDQMYVDVPEVRTADDALLVIKLMVFFELVDIERMLDRTHDPMADFINAVTADIIDHVGRHPFERFKEHTEDLGDLAWYPQLTERTETIGYRIGKVVYRGYHASNALQQMHNQAIETRTKLKLEDETERQAQELEDLKLERSQAREQRRQEMAEADTRHQLHLATIRTDQEIADSRKRHQEAMAAEGDQHRLTVEHEQALNAERLQFLGQLKGFDVDLTRYMVAQYQHPDRIIRIDGREDAQVHLHEREERA